MLWTFFSTAHHNLLRLLMEISIEAVPAPESMRKHAKDAESVSQELEAILKAKIRWFAAGKDHRKVARLYENAISLIHSWSAYVEMLGSRSISVGRNRRQGKIRADSSSALAKGTKELRVLFKQSRKGFLASLNLVGAEMGIRNESPINKKPRIFVGSSTEGLAVAEAVKQCMEPEFKVEVWNQSGAFQISTTAIESLEQAICRYDFGIFIFAPDDRIETEDGPRQITRGNVIFELGLFIGKLSRARAFVIHPKSEKGKRKIHVISDLSGVQFGLYDPRHQPVTSETVADACNKIRTQIQDLIRGTKEAQEAFISRHFATGTESGGIASGFLLPTRPIGVRAFRRSS